MGKIKVKASVTIVKWMAPATQGTQIHLIIFDSDATFCECIYQATFENCRGSRSLWCQISWGSTCDNQPSRTIQNFTSNGCGINSRRHFGITCDKELVINAILHSASILRTSSIQQPVSCSMNRLLSIRLTRTIWLMDNMTSQLACLRHVTVQIGSSWRIFAAHYLNWLSLLIHFVYFVHQEYDSLMFPLATLRDSKSVTWRG